MLPSSRGPLVGSPRCPGPPGFAAHAAAGTSTVRLWLESRQAPLQRGLRQTCCIATLQNATNRSSELSRVVPSSKVHESAKGELRKKVQGIGNQVSQSRLGPEGRKQIQGPIQSDFRRPLQQFVRPLPGATRAGEVRTAQTSTLQPS